MAKLILYKASAGSGKTYKITEEYLRLLFQYPFNFKHTLAVTFTNKAAAEMKHRIVTELSKITKGIQTGYAKLFQKEFNITENEIKDRAEKILKLILHNFSFFSIGTIDSFFNRVIQSFIKEIGLQTGFELELDNLKILNEVIDGLFNDIEENVKLKEWIVSFTEENVEHGRSWNLKNEINHIGQEIFKEIFQLFNHSIIGKLNDKEFLGKYLKNLEQIKYSFESQLSKLGTDALQLIENYSLQITDFKYGKSGFANYFNKIAEKTDFEPGKRVFEALNSVSNWYAAKSEFKNEIEAIFENGLNEILNKCIRVYEENSEEYFTSQNILVNFYTLGLLTDISSKVRQFTNENNIFLLSDVAKLLYSVIKENDAPFIYEKIGNIYRYFMVDEFQDTSEIQWKNIKPLILNSLAENNNNIVVGDVKQSIYRWRNSNWKVLALELENDFKYQGLENRILDYNWRSNENIIKFNNTFFSYASGLLQNQFNNFLSEESIKDNLLENSIVNAYRENVQHIPLNAPKDGLVYIEFLDNKEAGWKEQSLKNLPLFIKRLQDNGIKPNEMAILVRRKEEGKTIADFLYKYSAEKLSGDFTNYEVISDESLYVSGSPVVKFIISVLSFTVNPNDEINKATLLNLFNNYIIRNENINSGEIFNIQNVTAEIIFKELGLIKFLNLYEAVEKIIRKYELYAIQGQLAYIRSLQDLMIDYTRKNSSDIRGFLKWWEEKGVYNAIPFTEGIQAIRVLTIHKSKGLEFKAVLIPFCDWKIDHQTNQNNIIWCKPSKAPFNELEVLPLKYNQNLKNTIFKFDYFEERMKAYLDNLNLLYVAFTRAKEVLIASGPDSYKDEFKNVSDLLKGSFNSNLVIEEDKEFLIKNISENYNKEKNYFVLGNLKNLTEEVKEIDTDILGLTPEILDSTEIKLILKRNGNDYFNFQDDVAHSNLNYGNLMHEILEGIEYMDDLENSLKTKLFEGKITKTEYQSLHGYFKEKLNFPEVKEWFDKEWKIKTEAAILLDNGNKLRPDRVISKGNKLKIIDYKFTGIELEEHIEQVKIYMAYVNQMEDKEIEGFIWYVDLMKVIKVGW